MQTVIMAGGKGSRLVPFTNSTPKPLLEIGGIPVLEVIIRQLKNYGSSEVILTLNYLKRKIESHFNHGKQFGINIIYSTEDKPLGTAGPVKQIKHLDNNFLVVNGDILTDLPYDALYNYHCKNDALLTISSFKLSYRMDYGILMVNDKSEVKKYLEKPISDYNISMGIYAMNKKAVKYIPANTKIDMPDLINLLLKKKEKVMVFHHEGYWFDIGSVENIEEAEGIFRKHQNKFYW